MNNRTIKKLSNLSMFFLGCAFAITSLQSCSSNQPKTAETSSKYVLPDSLVKTISIDTVSRIKYSSAITLTGQVDFDEDHVIKISTAIFKNCNKPFLKATKTGQ